MSDTLFGSDNSAGRRRAMLRTAMGPTIAAALADPVVIEIMVNPDGVLRLDRLGEGRIDTGTKYEPAQVERIIRLVASHARTEVHGNAPIVSAELPPHGEGAGERFEGILPPVSLAPCFSIRKPAAAACPPWLWRCSEQCAKASPRLKPGTDRPEPMPGFRPSFARLGLAGSSAPFLIA